MSLTKSFDQFVFIFLLVMLGLIIALILWGDRVGVQVTAAYPQPDEAISIYGKLGLTFDQPMVANSVEDHFSITPQVEGDFFWDDDMTLWFSPSAPLNPEIAYRASIAAGAEAENGRALLREYPWTITVRHPDIAYLVLEDAGGELWRYETQSGLIYPLTNSGGNVIDFTVDPTGDWIAFSQVNPQGGSDLWLVDRNGLNSTKILECNEDRCSQAAWSPDGVWIAYSREEYILEESIYKPARVWTLYTITNETDPLYGHPEAFSHTPSFSPDGKRLATYNTLQNAIRILELETAQESVIPSVLLGVGDWSPDGQKLIYTDLVPSALEPNVGVYIADLATQEVDHAFGEFIPDTDFSQPRWSPDGKWVAFGARPVGGGISKGIWIINLDEGEPIPLTDDPTATFTSYRWDPWGERLVFQRFPIGGPLSNPSLWMWDHSTGETRLLVENGARPEWLP